jgi:hypothetical protein
VTITRREALQRATLFLGFAVSGSTVAAVMSGCAADPRPDWMPRFLTTMQLAQLAAMLDHLLPKTATPGALTVQVDRFVDLFLKDFASASDRQTFLTGLRDVDTRSRQLAGRAFVDLSSIQKDEIFRGLEAEAPPLAPTIWGGQTVEDPPAPVFYRQFKMLALVGYFTSKEVGLHITKYDPVPGRFDGCVPLADIGGAWTL